MRLTLAKQEESIKSLLSLEARMFTEKGSMVHTGLKGNGQGVHIGHGHTIVIESTLR